jgi:hypothetical protein
MARHLTSRPDLAPRKVADAERADALHDRALRLAYFGDGSRRAQSVSPILSSEALK